MMDQKDWRFFFFFTVFLFLVCFLFSLFLRPNFFVHGYPHSVSFSLLLQPRLSHMFYLIASVEFPSILHRHMAWLAGLFLFLFSIALVECCCFSSSGYSFTFVRSCHYGSYSGPRKDVFGVIRVFSALIFCFIFFLHFRIVLAFYAQPSFLTL